MVIFMIDNIIETALFALPFIVVICGSAYITYRLLEDWYSETLWKNGMKGNSGWKNGINKSKYAFFLYLNGDTRNKEKVQLRDFLVSKNGITMIEPKCIFVSYPNQDTEDYERIQFRDFLISRNGVNIFNLDLY